MASLETLWLGNNQIGDVGISALASACANGALASLQYLDLEENAIGDVGMSALENAVSTGAMASLKELYVNDGPLGAEHPALKAVCQARGIRLP